MIDDRHRAPPRRLTLHDDDIATRRALRRRDALAAAGAAMTGLAAVLLRGHAADAQTTAVLKRVTDPHEAGGDRDGPGEGRGPRRGRPSGLVDHDTRPIIVVEPGAGRRRLESEPLDAKGADGDRRDGTTPRRLPDSDRDRGLEQDPERRAGANGRGNRRFGRSGITDSDNYGENPGEDIPGYGRGTRLRPSVVTDADEGTLANPGDPPNNGRDFAGRR